MQQLKRLLVWSTIALVIAALGAPSLAPVAASATVPAAAPEYRFQPDGWRDGVPSDEVTSAQQRLAAWVNNWAASAEPRPPVDPVRQSQTTAAWTVMVFIAGDNNLEAAGLYDLNEMEVVGSSPDVNIVVEIDRSNDYVDWDGDWTEGRRYYIQQDDDLETISSPVVQNLGEINSGDANAVADFATWGITTYPAQKYMLVLWDHGGGWISHSSDDDSGDDLTLSELRGGLDRVIADTGIGKLEVIGFDMCLMGQLEVFETLTPYANYGIASQENEPGAGWFYVFLDELVKKPSMNGAELGQYVVDYFAAFFEEIWERDELYSLGVVDLSQAPAMSAAINRFAAAIRANPAAALSPVADARNNTIGYGGFDDPQYYDVWSSVDLYRFAELLSTISTGSDVQTAAQGVMQAVDQFVVRERHAEPLEGSHGVSIYFPRTFKAYKIGAFNERYPQEAPPDMAQWIDFLNVFHGTAATTVTTAPTVDVTGVYPDVASIYDPAVVTMEVSGRDILQVNYAVSYIIGENERIVLDFDYLVSRTTTPGGADIVDWSDGVTTRTFTWEADVPVLSDGAQSTFALLIPNRTDPAIAVVNGQYQSVRGGDPIAAQLVFDLNTRQSTGLWGINETAGGALQPFQLQVEAGDQFTPLWLTLDSNNDLSGQSLSDVTLTLQAEDSISFEKVPAPSGQYSISFVAENVNGEKTLNEAMIQVNNEGLDPSQRGYTDLTYGVTFRYPATWIRPRLMPDGRLFTGELVSGTLLSLYPYTDVSSSAETAQAVRASWNELQDLQVTQERQVQIQGVDATVIDYTYTTGQGEGRVGVVIAIYTPTQNVGYGFDLDAPVANSGPAQEGLRALVDSITFFQPAEIVGQSAWQTPTLAGGLVSFPVPFTWSQEVSGGWTLYGPPENKRVFVGLTWGAASGQSNEAMAQFWIDQLQTSVSGLEVQASEPFYIGNREWFVVVFTYQGDEKIAGAFFVTSASGQDYTFWIEAPDAQFDQLYQEVFSVVVGGFTFNG